MVKRYKQDGSPDEPSPVVAETGNIGEAPYSIVADLAELHDAAFAAPAFADSYSQTVETLKSIGIPDGHELGGPMIDVDGNKHDVRPEDIESIEPHPDNSRWRKVAMVGGAVVVMTIGGLLVARKKVGQRPTS